jgi:hypothetical protein
MYLHGMALIFVLTISPFLTLRASCDGSSFNPANLFTIRMYKSITILSVSAADRVGKTIRQCTLKGMDMPWLYQVQAAGISNAIKSIHFMGGSIRWPHWNCQRLFGGSDIPSLPATWQEISNCLYSCLGLSSVRASQEEIRSAYRKKALKWHPDKNRHSVADAELRFKEIQRAYTLLMDPNERAFYDANRERILAAGRRAARIRAESAGASDAAPSFEAMMKRRRAERSQSGRSRASAFDILMRRRPPAGPAEPRRTTSGPSAFDSMMRRPPAGAGQKPLKK